MAKVFISGYVSDAALHGPLRGLDVRASVIDGAEPHLLWQGLTNADGAFGFELRAGDHPNARCLVVELHHGRTRLAESTVEWHRVAQAGTNIELKVSEHVPHTHCEPLVLPFPIGFPGADRPLNQRGPVPLELERPKSIPAHPMAALPFLIQRSRPTDPDEDVEGSDDTSLVVARLGSIADPP
jgi:hypothetical protein